MIHVYVLSDRSGRLIAGVTRHIDQHLQQHHTTLEPNCSHKHQFDRLLLLESFRRSADAVAREKQLNCCTLTQKLELIRATNPKFDDLGPSLQS